VTVSVRVVVMVAVGTTDAVPAGGKAVRVSVAVGDRVTVTVGTSVEVAVAGAAVVPAVVGV
jgi:co-chaperonin GroES (HSP10)